LLVFLLCATGFRVEFFNFQFVGPALLFQADPRFSLPSTSAFASLGIAGPLRELNKSPAPSSFGHLFFPLFYRVPRSSGIGETSSFWPACPATVIPFFSPVHCGRLIVHLAFGEFVFPVSNNVVFQVPSFPGPFHLHHSEGQPSYSVSYRLLYPFRP